VSGRRLTAPGATGYLGGHLMYNLESGRGSPSER
jgi:hypothetical protein